MKKQNRLTAVFTVFLAVIMVVLAMTPPAFAASSSEIQEELSGLKKENGAIREQLKQIRGQYNATANEIVNLVNQKAAVDQEISLLHDEITNINDQITAYGQLIADTQDEMDIAQFILNGLNEKHKLRIRAMEEEGRLTYWQVIFESNSFTELLDRMNMMQEIAAADRQRLQEMEIAANQVEAAKAELELGRTELEDVRISLDETEAELEEKRTESDELLRDLAVKQEEFQALMEESEDAQDELMREIAAKEKELSKAKYQEELAKKAAMGQNPPSNSAWRTPVSGYHISSPFGMRKHPILGTAKMHNGVDMACSQGTPIYATRGGEVTAASYQAGGAGYYVSINHLDGFSSIYMHMTRYVVSAGQTVSQGQLIGYVGSTGLSTGPHLHFGISYAGSYVNPLAYL